MTRGGHGATAVRPLASRVEPLIEFANGLHHVSERRNHAGDIMAIAS